MAGRSQARLQERVGIDSAGNTVTDRPPERLAVAVTGSGLTRTITCSGPNQQFSGMASIIFAATGATLVAAPVVMLTVGMTPDALMTALATAIEATDAAAEAAVVLTGSGAARTLTCSSPITAISAFLITLTDTAPRL